MPKYSNDGPNTGLPEFYQCGICDHNHPVGFAGDCRDDKNRFTDAALDERYGNDGWFMIELGEEAP